jgi:hypothetical protein
MAVAAAHDALIDTPFANGGTAGDTLSAFAGGIALAARVAVRVNGKFRRKKCDALGSVEVGTFPRSLFLTGARGMVFRGRAAATVDASKWALRIAGRQSRTC